MGSQLVFITRGWIYFFPSLNDKDGKNDKESENSPMNLIGRGLWKPCHCCHGRVERAALCPPKVPDRHPFMTLGDSLMGIGYVQPASILPQ